ncbi:MAG: hypothetical protein GXP08_08675 [Gammaproteobacteria bacterium]|nr:hypothetical protein [Gammaproteobacteria bacterium]
MTNQIQFSVDQMLLEQGEYSPLGLLLQEGRLGYDDYEAWRNGEIEYLDTVLFGDFEQITELLTQAQHYLQRLGLQAEPVRYTAWHHHKPQPLQFSENTVLNRCFHQNFRKPKDQPQMDLFMDAPANNLVNGIQQALINRNETEARRQLEQLYDTAPDHSKLTDLEQLVNASENVLTPVNDIETELQALQRRLTPLAETLLGRDSHNLLIPQWRRLSEALQNKPYDKLTPTLHRSYTAIQSMDWSTARQAVEQIPNWHLDLELLQRHALACYRLQLDQEALMSWFLLCWQFPEHINTITPSFDADLNRYWTDFLELDPELPPQSFPAWLLLRNGGLVKVLPTPQNNASIPCADSYVTLYSLQTDKHKDSQATDNIRKRAQLKQQDPVLFKYYLDNISSNR